MANIDGMEGIAGDREFMDSYYLYTKIKKESESKTKKNGELKSVGEIIKEKKKCCISYLMAISNCITQIDKLPPSQIQRSYLDWIRWNRLIILTQLDRFKNDPHLEEHIDHIETLANKIPTIMEENFVFSDAEKAVSNQYAHAYARIKRQQQEFERVDIRVIRHCAKLLINYLDYLKNRCYIKSLDRADYSIDQLKSEVDHLTTSLRRMKDTALASDLKDALEHFLTFCKFDDGEAIGQDGLIEIALELAHKRATENFLQSAKRQLKEVIYQIKLAASRKIGEILKATSNLAHPLKHPIDTIKNLGYAIIHPIDTSKELWKHAKENPYKCMAIVAGSIAIGIGIGIGITGTVLALDLAISTITISPGILGSIAIVSSAATAIALVNTVVTGGRVLMIEKEAQRQIEKKEQQKLALVDENTAEGRRIARQVKLNRMMREQLEKTEEAFKQMEILEEQFEESRRQRINEMTPDQLNVVEKELDGQLNEVEEGLEATRNHFLTEKQKAVEIQQNLTAVKDGKAAVAFLLQNVKKNHSINPELENDECKSNDGDAKTESSEP